MSQHRKHALQIFRAALAASDPYAAVLRHLKFDGRTLIAGKRKYLLDRFDRIQVIGAGKAASAMARAVERLFGRRIAGGWINVKDGHAGHLRKIYQQECGHPVPDERGVEGTRKMAAIAREAGARDLLICVISGGASALTPAPSSMTLEQKQELTKKLLASGATIHEINTVRKHLSSFKGGQLAQLAYPATTIALILSDVIGDDLDVIGSGPTVGDRSTMEDARAVLTKYGIRHVDIEFHETPKPGDEAFAQVQNLIVGSNQQAIDAAYREAKGLGYRTMVLSTRIEGETRDVAGVHAAIAKEILASGRPLKMPACVLSGGETTVTIKGSGKGGRNQEFVLAAAIALEGSGDVTVLSAGTDGTDGPTDAAGAIGDASTVGRARALGMDGGRYLAENDSYRFFEGVEGLVKTGPTGTNVMDVRVVLVG